MVDPGLKGVHLIRQSSTKLTYSRDQVAHGTASEINVTELVKRELIFQVRLHRSNDASLGCAHICFRSSEVLT